MHRKEENDLAKLDAVYGEIVDKVFPAIYLEWEDHWQEIQKHELNRKNLGWLLHYGLQTLQVEARKKLVQDFYEALFPEKSSSQ